MLTVCLSLLLLVSNGQPVEPNPTATKFELTPLPYATNALEPVISKETMELHHGKHVQAYVDNLNRLVPGTEHAGKSLTALVQQSEGGIFNNAGQVLNHDLYFAQFSPQGGGAPSGKLAEAIVATWGTFDHFRNDFVAAGTSLFGSGWVWLAADKRGKLSITKEPNGSNPLANGLTPLLGFDVWEHAYYVDYRNRRADHLNALWNIVDWRVVEGRYK